MALGKSTQPFGLFCDAHCEGYNFPTLFYVHPNPSFPCFYQKIVQA
jgi:hypothetical protein